MTESLTITNLDFEYELAAGKSYQPPAIMRKVSHKWNAILRLLPGAQQAICGAPDILEQTHTHSWPEGVIKRLIPWGVTPRVLKLAQQHNLSQHFPDPSVVREVNDKRFSHRLEQTLGVALPYSCIVDDEEALRAAIRSCPYDWILKHPFGVSGRERVVGRPGVLIESAQRWAHRKFRQGWSLVFEPWVQEKQDSSIHFNIDPDGSVSLLGYCELLTDDSGTHRGNRVFPSQQPPAQVLDVGVSVAQELSRLGYWGAVGIDVLSGYLGGQPVLRPIVEINARQSFGRLTLALGQWVPKEWCYLWWHPTAQEFQQIVRTHGPFEPIHTEVQSPGLYTLPLLVDPEFLTHSLVLVGTTPALSLPESPTFPPGL